MRIESFFDPATFTLSYVVFDPDSHDAVVIDPVLDYDPIPSRVSLGSVEKIAHFVREHGLRLHQILETHAHADHLSGAQALKSRFGAGIVIGERITEVQRVFQRIFGLPDSFRTDGSQFDRLLADGAQLTLGRLPIQAIHTPGHTPACLSYLIGDAVFTGDALFIEDYGTGRCDFPRGSAADLYDSIHGKLYRLPDATRVFVGHDYLPGSRPLRFETTIGRSKSDNIQLRQDTGLPASLGYLWLPGLAVIASASVLTAPQGARVARLEVGTSTTADEQRVPGEHMAAPQVAHAARRVAGGVQGAQLLATKVQHVTVGQLHLRRTDAAGRRGRRARAGVLGQQGGTGDVVGMVVRFHRPAQPQAPRLQHGQVTLDLCIDRIDDQCLACVRVVQQVGAGAGGGVQELQRVHGGGSELFKIKTGYSARPYCASSYYFYSIYSHCGAGSSRSWRRKRA